MYLLTLKELDQTVHVYTIAVNTVYSTAQSPLRPSSPNHTPHLTRTLLRNIRTPTPDQSPKSLTHPTTLPWCPSNPPILPLHMHPRNNKAPTNATKPPTSHAQLSRSPLCFCGIMHSEAMLRSIQASSLRWRAVNDTRVGHGECLLFFCVAMALHRRHQGKPLIIYHE
jgi:hypothetical protein